MKLLVKEVKITNKIAWPGKLTDCTSSSYQDRLTGTHGLDLPQGATDQSLWPKPLSRINLTGPHGPCIAQGFVVYNIILNRTK